MTHCINKMEDKNHNILNKKKASVRKSTYSPDKKKRPSQQNGYRENVIQHNKSHI